MGERNPNVFDKKTLYRLPVHLPRASLLSVFPFLSYLLELAADKLVSKAPVLGAGARILHSSRQEDGRNGTQSARCD
jgi:hypothetical protein